MYAWLRRRARAAGALDSLELEQATMRVVIYPIVYSCIVLAFLWDREIDDVELRFLRICALAYPMTFVPVAWILLRPGINALRRCAGVAIDVLAVTLGLLLANGGAAVICVLYLWIAIGNGFRFGLGYLYFAQLLALGGSAAVVAANPFWRAQPLVATVFITLLLAVPAYVGVLVSRFHAASGRLRSARSEAEAANVAKTRLLAAASHDLRQPMQALSMYASVLEKHSHDEDVRRVVHGIQLSVSALERMFDSLLDIARIESGVVRPATVAFPLQPLLERVVVSETPLAAQKGLALRAVRTSASVASDPALLERILRNLVTNAIRYTERGGIVVGCRRASGGRVRLDVVDTGIGIAAPEQERIFDEYYQVDGRAAQGLGLGLAIVKSLCGLLGHALTVRSAPGRGSVFSVTLPRAAPVPEPSAEAVLPMAQALDGAVVAVVDDDAEIRRSFGLLVRGWGCRPFVGASAAEVEAGLRAARAVPCALIVDYRLAGTANGLQAIEQLRAAFGASIPALLITGTHGLALADELRAGGIALAVKPVPPGKIRAFVESAVRGKG